MTSYGVVAGPRGVDAPPGPTCVDDRTLDRLWTYVNRRGTVPPIDPADLLDATEVAELLGLAHRQAVSTYRGRYADFPAPFVEKGSGKCVLWLRQDVEAWAASRRGGT